MVGVLDGGMCVIAGGRGVGDRESAMFGMQLRPLRLSDTLPHCVMLTECCTLNLGFSTFLIGQ